MNKTRSRVGRSSVCGVEMLFALCALAVADTAFAAPASEEMQSVAPLAEEGSASSSVTPLAADNGEGALERGAESVLDLPLMDEAVQVIYIEDKSPVDKAELSTKEELLELGRQLYSGSASNGKYLALRAFGGTDEQGSDDVAVIGDATASGNAGTSGGAGAEGGGVSVSVSGDASGGGNAVVSGGGVGAIGKADANSNASEEGELAAGGDVDEGASSSVGSGASGDGSGGAGRTADVIFVGTDSNVTTTRCLFLIIAGYLEGYSSFTEDEAYQAAQKICWWNSAHYDDAEYFASLFGDKVAHSFADKAKSIGLSSSYKDWPGTRIIVPWASSGETAAGGTGAVDEGLLADAGKMTGTGATGTDKRQEPVIEQAKYVPKSIYGTQGEDPISERFDVPSGFLILLGTVCLAIIVLFMLLIKVIMDLARDRG